MKDVRVRHSIESKVTSGASNFIFLIQYPQSILRNFKLGVSDFIEHNNIWG